ncbi:hypothetical protein [Neopusillimonas maritima]|uniref:Uncharacterized protein n=1 Tax=Neopusillimonas maritima TaxID=2026239 RepID=A0A3A1YUU6_9BURK|nr:hypothetical protein [Neopusillimonas maritima]RIY41982.1 hypothetical protein CJP73_00610 [Neopusillimonas maritima]
MTNVKMPDPVAFLVTHRVYPEIGSTLHHDASFAVDKDDLSVEDLITTTQAQAYADERVMEALEKALDALNQARDSIGAGSFAEDRQHERGIVGPYLDGLDDEIRALFPKQSMPA